MIKKILILISLSGFSCTSDDIIRSQKNNFYDIYRNIIFQESNSNTTKVKTVKTLYNREWLSNFNQPIILLSSVDGKKAATLVALGNYKNTLTWVSVDGISVSFENGILIATRGYSQDLLESQQSDLNTLFLNPKKDRLKTYRYLNGQNDYRELSFSCTVKTRINTTSSFLDLTLNTTKFTEACKAGTTTHTNEYYVLPNTNIVLKSKQWISETNGYIKIYNYYAFQNNIR